MGCGCAKEDTAKPHHRAAPAPGSSSASDVAPDSPVATASPPSTSDTRKHCRYFMAGHCRNGTSCPDVHGPDTDPAGAPSATSTPAPAPSDGRQHCRYFMAGYCRAGASCPDVHGSAGATDDPVVAAFLGGGGLERQESDAEFRRHMHMALAASRNDFETVDINLMRHQSTIIFDADLEDAIQRSALEQAQQRRSRPSSAATGASPLPIPSAESAASDPVDSFPVINFDATQHKAKAFVPEDKEGCAICFVPYEEGEEVMILPCVHWFHKTCIQEWLAKHDLCPMCRRDVRK